MQGNVSAVHSQLTPSVADARIGKYLAFEVNGETCCIPVLQVREIIGLQDITFVPQTPAFVRGVTNLRGKVIPIVDLRRRFNLPPAADTPRTCIIVVQVAVEGHRTLMGIVVDTVAEVLSIGPADIEDTPMFGQGVSTPYLLGMANIKGQVKLLLDIDKLLTMGELNTIDSILPPASAA